MTGYHAALLGIQHPHAPAHLRTLQRLPEVESISVWDPEPFDPEREEGVSQSKIRSFTTDLGQILGDPAIHFVIGALPNHENPRRFVQVLEAGKDLLAEKPIGRNAEETRLVLDAAEQSGRRLGVCYQNRANPVVQEVRRLILGGAIGPLMSVEMRMITTAVRFRNPDHWLFDKERSGGGILSWLGCHYIDLMHYLTEEEPVAVSAEVATRSGEAIDVEDVATLAMRLGSGAVASLHAGYVMALSGGGYFNKGGYDVYVGVNGRLGRIWWRTNGAPMSFHFESAHPNFAGAPRRSTSYELGESPAYGGIIGEEFVRSFLASTRGEGDPIATGQDALRVARVVDGAYESSETGRRVDLG